VRKTYPARSVLPERPQCLTRRVTKDSEKDEPGIQQLEDVEHEQDATVASGDAE
jgi:hypothetical protein